MARRLTYILSFLLLSGMNVRAQLIINELMQSNIDCIFDDETNEFPDSWVELYNSGSDIAYLNEYSIGLTDDYYQSWTLPSGAIAPGQFVIIYCDKAAYGRHTNFRLESGKDGAVYLFRNGGIANHIAGMPKQPAPNVAYGRASDGSPEWGYMLTPTPGSANRGGTSDIILDEPQFSEAGRVTTGAASISLALSVPEGSPAGTVIRYTLNGTEPDEGSTLYQEPLNIRATTTVRAKLFCSGCVSPRSTTQSYIYLPRTMTMPVVSLVSNNDYFYNSRIGILYEEAGWDGRTENYEFNWRRPVNMEYFPAEGQPSVLNQLCETRVQGGGTRSENYLKSLALYANKRFGAKRFDYEFFPDQKPGLTKYKSLLLRNAGNDFFYCYMRDAVVQRVMGSHVDVDWSAWQPAIVYLNGQYIGMLNIRERSNESNVYTNHDGMEDIDLLENWSALKEGTRDNVNAFKRFWHQDGHSMDEYAEWIDIEEYINAMITDFYFCNLDGFDFSNSAEWRPRTEDGRWRMLLKDKDYGLGLYRIPASYKIFEWFYNPQYDEGFSWGANSEEATLLFRQLMKDPQFYRMFINRMTIYMGDFLNEEGIHKIWDPMVEKIEYEYPFHQKQVGTAGFSFSRFLNEARTWVSRRTDYMYDQLANFYGLKDPTELIINNQLSEDELDRSSFTFNEISLSTGVFNGRYYPGEEIRLKGETEGDQVIVGWDVTQLTNNYAVASYFDGDELNFDMPRCTTLLIDALYGSRTGINSLGSTQWKWQSDGDGIVLTQLPSDAIVTLYDVQGRQIRHHQTHDSSLHLSVPANQHVLILRVGSQSVKIIR